MKRKTMWIGGFFMIVALLAGGILTGCTSDPSVMATIAPGPTATVNAARAAVQEPTAAASEPALMPRPTKTIESREIAGSGEEGESGGENAALTVAVYQTASGELSEFETAGILFMREEEKLARDVYLTLFERWGLAIFENIAGSEATHMAAVKTLIDRYNLPDPAEGKAVGEFANQELQALYDELVATGGRSLEDALKVGAAIEEIDILDLQQHIAQTDKRDIQRVYENLMKGSRNHLRSFVSVYEKGGQIYQPQYLSQGVFDEIINLPADRGGRGTRRASQ